MKLKIMGTLAILAYVAGGVTVAHNVTVVHSPQQPISVTWGTAGGCEVDLGPGRIEATCWQGMVD